MNGKKKIISVSEQETRSRKIKKKKKGFQEQLEHFNKEVTFKVDF